MKWKKSSEEMPAEAGEYWTYSNNKSGVSLNRWTKVKLWGKKYSISGQSSPWFPDYWMKAEVPKPPRKRNKVSDCS